MSNDKIMTDEEIHEFGINIVLEDLRKNGFMISAVTTDRYSNPQIVAKYNSQVFHVIVRTACYPNKGNIESKELGFRLLQEANNKNAQCYFASVGIANADGTTDLEMATPIRGAGYYISYNGVEKLIPEKIISTTNTVNSALYDKNGEIAGAVLRQPDGRHKIIAGDKADGSAALMSLCIVFANVLQEKNFGEQRILFSKWAHLPHDSWTQTHQQVAAQALMHFFMEARTGNGNLPPNIQKALLSFSPQVLPELKYPLTKEIRDLFSSIFRK